MGDKDEWEGWGEIGCELEGGDEIGGGAGGLMDSIFMDGSGITVLFSKSPKEVEGCPPSPETSGFGEVNGLAEDKSLGLLKVLKSGEGGAGGGVVGVVFPARISPKVVAGDETELLWGKIDGTVGLSGTSGSETGSGTSLFSDFSKISPGVLSGGADGTWET